MNSLDLILYNEHLKVFILSMLPITELRGSIPWAIKYYSLPVEKIKFYRRRCAAVISFPTAFFVAFVPLQGAPLCLPAGEHGVIRSVLTR